MTMRPALFLGMFVCLAVSAGVAGAESYAEKLGWGPEDRVLIIHCDDAGMSLGSNLGIQAAVDFGTSTSVSAMMPCPWVPGFARYVQRKPDLDMGLHLTLTSEWDDYRWLPVAGKAQVPGLADEMGCLWDNNRLLKEHASPDEVELEIRAQIDRAQTLGLPVTHLDSHMYALYSHEPFFERLKKVAVEKQIPILIAAGHLHHAASEGNDPAIVELFRKHADEIWNAGLPVLDDFHSASYGWKTTDKKHFYLNFLRTLRPGVTEMIVHPTAPSEVMSTITGNRYHLYGDYYALIDPEVKAAIREEGIILTTWRELKARRDRAPEPR